MQRTPGDWPAPIPARHIDSQKEMRMKRYILKAVFVFIAMSGMASIAAADVKIKTKNTIGSVAYQTTTWIKGARLRTSQGIGLDTLDQCDLNRTLLIKHVGRAACPQRRNRN